MRTIGRVFRYLARYPLYGAGTLACAIASTLLVVVFPAATKVVIDDAIRGGRPELLVPSVLAAAAAFFAQHGFNALRILLNNTFEQRVIFDLRSDLYAHLQHLPLTWFDNRATGDVMTRVVEDVQAMERVLIDGIEQGVVAILQIFVVAAMLFHYQPALAGLALLPVPFLAVGALLYTLTAGARYRKQRVAASAMNALLHDNLAGIRQIKSYVREAAEHGRFNAASERLRQATLTVMRAWAAYHPSMHFLQSTGLLLVLGFGGQMVLDGRMQIGEMAAFLTLVGFLYDPVGRLHQLNQLMQAGRAAAERVFEIMDEKVEPGSPEAGSALRLRGDVRFRNVSFAYDPALPVLSNINLHAEPGQTVALVGPTGAGKSTLVNLLTRFYEYDAGEILVDGRPLREYTRPELRSAIGLVTQESFLFNGTVRDNLRLGRADASDDAMLEALAAANARAFVERLPDGLGTMVGERGVKLSVGEKQRVSIARALLKNPPILILDEATASVDSTTERLIQEALDRLLAGRTAFVIAHRLSTIRRADQILVLQGGKIVERGTHEELLRKEGLYAQLCRHSLLAETAEPAPVLP